MIEAFKDSFTLLYFRWALIRSMLGKVGIIVGILGLIGALVAVSNTGSMIKEIATLNNPDAEAAKIFAQSYLRSFQIGELGALVSTTLTFAISSVVLAPFTGTSMTSLLPHHQLVSITKSSRHRFSDSVLAQFFSSISLLQLLTLTFVASLLTIDEGRFEGVLYAWGSWTVLVMLSCLSVWISEFLSRRFTMKGHVTIFGSVLVVVGTAVLLDPHHGTTLFGVGDFYATVVRSFHTFTWWQILMAVFLLVILDIGLLYATYRMCVIALAEPERQKVEKKQRKYVGWRSSSMRYVEISHLIFSQVWRNPEIKKPLVAVTLFSSVALVIFADQYNLLTGMILIIPLISALSWGANLFGTLGSGWVWLSSNPFIRNNIIYVAFFLQVSLSFFLFAIMSVPSLMAGKIDGVEFASAILGLVVVSTTMSRSALSKSVHNPYPYRAGQRGESALSPAMILIYTLRFTMWAGLLGLLTTSIPDIYIQLLATVFVAAWACLRIALLQHRFVKLTFLQANIVRTVGSDNN